MSHELDSPATPERKKEPADDNARKLVLLKIDAEKLTEIGAHTYDMEVQWVDTSEDSESKIVRKRNAYDETDVRTLLIAKSMVDGKRSTHREPVKYEDFSQFRKEYEGQPYLTKRRSEFMYVQDGVEYALKYDEFKIGIKPGGGQRLFCMLEVDADSDEQRDKFDPGAFELAQIYAEVTGNPDYTGYRIIPTLQKLQG